MSERVTIEQVRTRCNNVNRRLESTGRRVYAEQRNGHVALDEFSVSGLPGGGQRSVCVRTITVGTKREIAEFLHAMMVGIDLSRSEDWRVQGVS